MLHEDEDFSPLELGFGLVVAIVDLAIHFLH